MSGLNDEQKKIAETIDGVLIVDAGPGTGKTHTLVARYINMIERKIDPLNILMLTFTRNAAQEMKDRISNEMLKNENQSGDDNQKSVRNIKSSTFDAYCLKIVQNSPESVTEFFGIKESLSRNAILVENDSLNKEYFRSVYSRFVNDHGSRYIKNGQNPPALVDDSVDDVYALLSKLMSRGVIPLEFEWFGKGSKIVEGRTNELKNKLKGNEKILSKAIDEYRKNINDYAPHQYDDWMLGSEEIMPETVTDAIVDGDRNYLFEFIRDLYFEYIRRSIADNRLTFGLCELFAFAILYCDERSRKMHSVDYMMVDEFQDTNELQLKICLLLLKKPNLCVVGDWKQGIYGFRYVSTKNILEFEERTDLFITQLNRDEKRIDFTMPDAVCVNLVKNYRSSSLVLEKAFEALSILGSDDDSLNNGEIVELEAMNDTLYGENTAFEMISGDDRESEASEIVAKILEYRYSGKYAVFENEEKRHVKYKDIAVLCRSGELCKMVLDACNEEHIPAFFQGDLEIMSTREGKLALAWLRYVNNEKDIRGPVAILADRGYSLANIKKCVHYRGRQDFEEEMPIDIKDQRASLLRKKRRPNDLLTSIFEFYHLDNDITQTIINTLSSAYSGSLLTISDLIRLIEEDIKNGTRYMVDPALNTEAVTIQTAHKSKGLEYPIVIVGGIDFGSFPNTSGDKTVFRFDDLRGIRCSKEYYSKEIDGVKHEIVKKSWAQEVLNEAAETDYSEERRLLFVALSRAKQYLTIAGYVKSRKSKFFEHYGLANIKKVGVYEKKDDDSDVQYSVTPEIKQYAKKRDSLSVHDLMETVYVAEGTESEAGKGPEYGERVHSAAELMARGKKHEDLEEMSEVRDILDSLEGAQLMTEVRCILPVGDVSVKGTIDLLAVFDDRVEIHDYKTDLDDKYQNRYILQLSAYYHAARSLGKDVVCYLDYVSQKKRVRIEPLSLKHIEEAIDKCTIL